MKGCENRVLRIFGSKEDGVTGDWRRLLNVERYESYSSPDIIRIIRLLRTGKGEHTARIEETYIQSLGTKN
jgi:hypothetical protein